MNKTKLKLLVAGIINIETVVNLPDLQPGEAIPRLSFPFFGINNCISGSGYNVAKALHMLGDEISLLSVVGDDLQGKTVMAEMEKEGLNTSNILTQLKETPLSTVLYGNGDQKYILSDLKDVQEYTYSMETFKKEIEDVSTVILTNANFCRPFLPIAKAAGKLIATDVQAISDIYDEYNRDFMEHADILFISNDNLDVSPTDLLMELRDIYPCQIMVVGCGEKGASMFVRDDGFVGSYAAVKTRQIVNKVGAGDALFSAFMHFYVKSVDPYYSLKNALLFASYKIGTAGSSKGFMTEEQLNHFYHLIWR